ncbi:hypothetical protein [Roseicyclus marinus]|uniref:hypothetical protein n=1 Tax=Roseicyclus marinus TaxID=2161673 RepID=UPI00241090F1|nr:hypothetical protein [Roseicyclus marinus]MDG3040159.1 hypothetical protein [Roseicyclus marinus]
MPGAGRVMIGAGLVAAGALSALWVPPGLLGALALLALLRICWLEDNIVSDLFGRDRPPPGYRNAADLRRLLMLRVLGIWPRAAAEVSAHQVATAMRTEAQVWGCLLIAMAAGLVAQRGVFGPVTNLCFGAVLFALALMRADRLTLSLFHCETGRALPDHLLLPARRRLLAERKR